MIRDVEGSNNEGINPDNTNETVFDSNSVPANTVCDIKDSNNEGTILDNAHEDQSLWFCATTQHKCSYCGEHVCNFCSITDPNNSNESSRIHKKGECKVNDMEETDNTADDSDLSNLLCDICFEEFINETELDEHKIKFHAFNTVECIYCNDILDDDFTYNIHIEEKHRDVLYPKRKRRDIEYLESDDDDNDWAPSQDEIEDMEENGNSTVTYKRRKVEVKENDDMRKDNFVCNFCDKTFTRKERLQWHISKYCKGK